MSELKLKVDKKSGHLICSVCGKLAKICKIINHNIVCIECVNKGGRKGSCR
jgi:hypothetical protein